MIAPLPFTWDGDAMIPTKPHLADKLYVVGDTYWLEPNEPRSAATHNHFFATLAELWRNLPEDVSANYPTPDHLRKWCLIKAGFADERSIVCSSKAEALRFAAFVKPMDEYAIVVVRDAVVKVYTAQSQSKRAMGAKLFQGSKEAVLDIASGMVGVTAEDAAKNARTAA